MNPLKLTSIQQRVDRQRILLCLSICMICMAMANGAAAQISEPIFGTISKIYANKKIILSDGLVYKYKQGPLPADTVRYYENPTGEVWDIEVRVRRHLVTYDTIYRISEMIEPTDTRFTVVNMITYTNSGKPAVTDKSFAGVTDIAKPASGTTTFNGAMVEFYGERFAGHGVIQIYIDDVMAGTFNQGAAPFVTDFSRMAPTFRKKVTPGPHTISVRSTSGQHIIDAFQVYTYTLQPKP